MMSKPVHNRQTQRPRTLRLRGYDYCAPGAYFITICTAKQKFTLGRIVKGEMRLNQFGRVVKNEWLRTATIRPELKLDAFIVMPNHFHAIVAIEAPEVGAHRRAPLHLPAAAQTICVGAHGGAPLQRPPRSLGSLIAGFKSAVTICINRIRRTPRASLWQRNYYEHIIRNDDELNKIRWYVLTNPQRWRLDPDNPRRTSDDTEWTWLYGAHNTPT